MQIEMLNRRYENRTAQDVLEAVIINKIVGQCVIVSSFGTESAVLLHMATEIDRFVPAIFLDTGKHFPETLSYIQRLRDKLGLEGLRIVSPDPAMLAEKDPNSIRWSYDPDMCCQIRKTLPLRRALRHFDATITGRKAFQAGTRAALELFELQDGKAKVNPLAKWSKDRIDEYFDQHNLPRHPLEAEGYLSIGCAPCTSKVRPGEDPRSGRWRGLDKTECGIHIPEPSKSGKLSD